MLAKTIKYTDYNGNEREEEFFFHFNKAELVEMQMSEKGGLEKKIRDIVDAKDTAELVKLFKELCLKAYGVKSEDGRRFIKSDQLREEFSQTEAYSNLFMELAFNSEAAIDFVNGILPQELKQELEANQVKELVAQQ